MKIIIYGDPKSQKRARFSRRGKYVQTYDPSKYEKENFICQILGFKPEQPLECPLILKCRYFLPIPCSFSKRKKMNLSSETTPHVKRPDIDNLDKFVMDCLNSIFYKDDSQIFYKVSGKVYSETPRTEIELIPHQDFTENRFKQRIPAQDLPKEDKPLAKSLSG